MKENKEEERLAIGGLSCAQSGIDHEVVERAPDEHNLVSKCGFSCPPAVAANPGSFDCGDGVLDHDAFAREFCA